MQHPELTILIHRSRAIERNANISYLRPKRPTLHIVDNARAAAGGALISLGNRIAPREQEPRANSNHREEHPSWI